MLQVVCIKQVADTETRVKVAADGRSLDPAGVTWILNPYDEFALEQALRLKEKAGAGEVVVVSLGGAGVQTTLRNALAMGADRADPPPTDGARARPARRSRARSPPRSAARTRDLVWFGSRRSTTTRPQVGPMVAELLELPCVTVVAAMSSCDGRVGRGSSARSRAGARWSRSTLPAVLTADKGLNEPRYASLKGIMAAKKKPIEEKPVDARRAAASRSSRSSCRRRARRAASSARAWRPSPSWCACCAKRRR